jgi:hypothetical protein
MSNSIEMNTVQNGVFVAPVAEAVESKKGLVEKAKEVVAAAAEKATVVGKAFVDHEAGQALQESNSKQIAEGKAAISANIKKGLETAGNRYFEVLSMPIAPIANLKTKEFTPDENASGLTNFVKKALNANANMFTTIAVGTEKFAREVGSKTYTVLDQGLSYLTNVLECVGLGNLGRLIQKTLAIAISALVRAVFQTVSQIAHVVPVALFLVGCVVAAAAAIKLAQEAITGTITLALLAKQSKDNQDLEAQVAAQQAENVALRQLTDQLQVRLAKLEANTPERAQAESEFDGFLSRVEGEELEAEESEEEATPAPVVVTPAPGMSRGKKVAYTTVGLGVVSGLAAAALNRQAVASAFVTYAPALAARVAPYIPAFIKTAVGM